ncbi:hypothetical protein A7P55_20885 [Acinetobacter sp. Ac_5812]|nr:hypothetical protein [Acinetobacter sp. Ac_5812]
MNIRYNPIFNTIYIFYSGVINWKSYPQDFEFNLRSNEFNLRWKYFFILFNFIINSDLQYLLVCKFPILQKAKK